MRLVLMGAKVNWRHTRLLPVTTPPGTSAQALPVQYCTWKSVKPNFVKVIDGVGCSGAAGVSWIENTSISLIVWVPLKLICSQSG